MKTGKALLQKKLWMKEILGVAVMLLVFSLNGFTSEAAEGKVTAETAIIRAEASTTSEVIGSTIKGKTVDIVGAVKDASGTVWYKVPNGNNVFGYIRSDLIETSDTIEISETAAPPAAASSNSGESTAKPAETVPTPIEEKQAAVSVESAVVRTGASTKHDSVASLPRGTGVTLIGEASDGSNKWYQITSDYNGRTIKGYVRSDLVTIGAAPSTGSGENNSDNPDTNGDTNGGDTGAEGEGGGEQTGEGAEGGESTEGEGNEQPQEAAAPEHNDYEVVYDEETYWLYDNINETMMPVTNLLQVAEQANENSSTLQKQIKNEKIIIIVLAVIIVLLVVTVTILLFKLRDAYYYEEYEEEEEEIEEEPAEPRKKKKRVVEEEESVTEEPAPVRKKKVREGESQYSEEKRTESSASLQNAELKAAEKKQANRKPAQRKAQNFLVDDDEFEFEFLNMDDKDL